MTTTNVSAAQEIVVPVAVIEAVGCMRKPIMISHVVPDADALGSILAMSSAFADDQTTPKVSLPPSSLSERLNFLLNPQAVVIATNEDFINADGFVTLDTAKKPRCNVEPQLKDTDWSTSRPMVNIDHHATNTRFGSLDWIVEQASSTCEMVYFLLRSAGKPITPAMASQLFAGIQTDTLGFSLPTTTASSLRAAADLVSLGADVAMLGERLARSQSTSEFDLLRVIYENTQLEANGRLAYSFASFDDIRKAGCTASDIDDQITVPRSLDGVELAMLFTEGIQGKTRINFRGSGVVTVVELAGQFKGGGHSQAAGAILDGTIEQAIAKVLPKAIEHLEQFPRSA